MSAVFSRILQPTCSHCGKSDDPHELYHPTTLEGKRITLCLDCYEQHYLECHRCNRVGRWPKEIQSRFHWPYPEAHSCHDCAETVAKEMEWEL